VIPDPTVELISWAVMRTAEAVVGRAADRIATRMKTRIVTATRHRAAAVLPKRGRAAR